MHDAQDSKLSSIPTTARCPNFIKFELSIELVNLVFLKKKTHLESMRAHALTSVGSPRKIFAAFLVLASKVYFFVFKCIR